MSYSQLQQEIAHSISQDNFDKWLDCIPELNKLILTPQDPTYHGEGNVWIHTQMVLRALIAQDDFAASSDEDKFVLFMTALLHDIAKPETTIIDEISGRISQPRHSQKGEISSRILLWRNGVPFELRKKFVELSECIKYHFML